MPSCSGNCFPGAQNSLKIQLAEDAKRIKDNNVNASFYMTSVVHTRLKIGWISAGELKTWIGDSAPYSENKSSSCSLIVWMVSAGWRVLEK